MTPFELGEQGANPTNRRVRLAAIASLGSLLAGFACINQWYAQQIADFIAKLKAIPEGNDLLVSIANAMGVTPSSNGMSNRFGDTAFCKGPLSGLTA